MKLATVLLAVSVTCDTIKSASVPQIPYENGELKQVHVIFRHGHRVPVTKFPTDPNANASLWDDGVGMLTKLGKQQAYQLGQHLKVRYENLLLKERAWKNVYTISSDVSRTLMTAATVLAGLLPPFGIDRWSNIDWQPAPIHTKSFEADSLLASSLPCPRFQAMLKRLVDNISWETRDIYKYISRRSGLRIKSARSVSNLYTCLEIEREAGLILPDWTKRVFPGFMKNETKRYFSFSSSTETLSRLRSGPLIKEILTFNPKQPLRLYSTHDTVISALLGSLGFRHLSPPGFLSTTVIEYREHTNGEIFAQIFWREGPDDTLQELKWPHCGYSCSVSRLKEIYEHIIPTNWNEECTMDFQPPAKNTEYIRTISIVPPVIFGGIALIVIISVIIYRRKSNYEILR